MSAPANCTQGTTEVADATEAQLEFLRRGNTVLLFTGEPTEVAAWRASLRRKIGKHPGQLQTTKEGVAMCHVADDVSLNHGLERAEPIREVCTWREMHNPWYMPPAPAVTPRGDRREQLLESLAKRYAVPAGDAA